MSIIKKLLFVGLAIVVAGVVVTATGARSYVETAAGIVTEKVRGSIPLEFEIRRAEELIEGIVPEIRACKRVVAEEEVAVEYLRDEIASISKEQSRSRNAIDVQRTALSREDSTYWFGGRRYSHQDLQIQLEHAFDEFKNNDMLLESKKRLYDARVQSLAAAKSKLEKVRLEKSRLESQVQNLHAQLRQVEAMEAHSSQFAFDDSKLAQARGLLDRCKRSLDVAQRMIENDRDFAEGFVAVEEPDVDRDILSEVSRYFASREGEASDRRVAVADSAGN